MSTFQFDWKPNRNFCVTAKHFSAFMSLEGEEARDSGKFDEFALKNVVLVGYYKTKKKAQKAMVGCWNSENATLKNYYTFLWNRKGECIDGCN